MDNTKENLEAKKLPELKQIAKNLGLKTSGKKADIINNILNHQSKPIKSNASYFDLLPGDINKMVNKYQIENDTNKKVLEYLLYETLTAETLLDYRRTEKSREERHKKLEKIFRDNGLEIYIVRPENVKNPHPSVYQGDVEFIFEWENPGPVPDSAIRNILPIFAYYDIDRLNYELEKLKSKFRVIKLEVPVSGRQSYLYEIVEINSSYVFGNIHKLA